MKFLIYKEKEVAVIILKRSCRTTVQSIICVCMVIFINKVKKMPFQKRIKGETTKTKYLNFALQTSLEIGAMLHQLAGHVIAQTNESPLTEVYKLCLAKQSSSVTSENST